MDDIKNWILSAPDTTFVYRVVGANFDTSHNISGELFGGGYLLLAFRRGSYAHIFAMSYWSNKSLLIGTLENREWRIKFEPVITAFNSGKFLTCLSNKKFADLPTDKESCFFDATAQWRSIEGVSVPKYAKGILCTNGDIDASIVAIDPTGNLYIGFRNIGTWTRMRKL